VVAITFADGWYSCDRLEPAREQVPLDILPPIDEMRDALAAG
jgi:hypothetical protein